MNEITFPHVYIANEHVSILFSYFRLWKNTIISVVFIYTPIKLHMHIVFTFVHNGISQETQGNETITRTSRTESVRILSKSLLPFAEWCIFQNFFLHTSRFTTFDF